MINKDYDDLRSSDCVQLLSVHCEYLRTKGVAKHKHPHGQQSDPENDTAQDLNEGKYIAILHLLGLSIA